MAWSQVREELITALSRTAGSVTGRLASRQDTVPPENPRMVVIRRCCLGDVLQTTAALAALRRAYPKARIDYATTDYAAPALSNNPDVSAVVSPSIEVLKAGRYDVALTLERSPRAAMLAWLARIPIRVGPNSQGRGFAHNLPVACHPSRSEAELYLDCVRRLDVSVEGAAAVFRPSDADRARAAELLGKLADARPVALAPGGAVNPGMTLLAKRWPAERFAEIARRAAEATGQPAVLLGARSDAAVCAEVSAMAGSATVDLTGRTSLGEAGAVLSECALLVSNDSALLHLAAAVRTPFAGIYGPSDPIRHRPFGAGEVVCAPVPREAYRNGFTELDCIQLVTTEEVWAACLRLLAAPRDPNSSPGQAASSTAAGR